MYKRSFLIVVLLGVAELEHELAHSGDSNQAQNHGHSEEDVVGGASLQEHRFAIGFLEFGLDVLELLVTLGDLGGGRSRRPRELARVLQHHTGEVPGEHFGKLPGDRDRNYDEEKVRHSGDRTLAKQE